VEPAPFASISQLARAPLPIADPAEATGEELRFGAGLRRGAAERVERARGFELLERAPERATVLLAMSKD
jgi:hypothetical protein